MSTRALAADVVTIDLTEPIAAGTDIVAGQPRAAYRDLAEVGAATVGVWEMTAGTARDSETDEVFVVLSGAGQVSFEDGERIDLAPGVMVQLREGERTEWVITATLRKLYVAGSIG